MNFCHLFTGKLPSDGRKVNVYKVPNIGGFVANLERFFKLITIFLGEMKIWGEKPIIVRVFGE